MEPRTLLQRLGKARWHVAARTIGNDHATLVGLLVDWWISLAPERHRALEGGPSNGYSGKGTRGQCDALLCDLDRPVGVLEVEGSRYLYTVRKLGSFFAARYRELASLRFGILVLYTYDPVGRGADRLLPPAASPGTLEKVKSVTAKYPDKPVVAIALNKRYVRQQKGIRARTEYYFGEPSKIEGILFLNGRRIGSELFYDSRKR